MWVCGDNARVPSLRAGAALAGMDADDLWQACYDVSGEVLAFDSVVEAITAAEDVSEETCDVIARAINWRLHQQGLAPLFRTVGPRLGR